MAKTISHGWTTAEPDDPTKDVSERNLNDHAESYTGLTTGHVLRASGATAADFAAIQDADLPSTIARDSEVTSAVAALSTVYQPLDSDLTAIAALTTTSYGRALLELANAAAARTALGLGTAALAATGDFQPLDSDLTSIAALTTTSFGRGLLALADAAALAGNHSHGGGSAIGSFPTLIQQSNFASSSGTGTITLGATPETGDVIFVAAGNVQFPVQSVSGAGATWTFLRGQYLFQGNYTTIDLWMGVVGGSPSTGITITFEGSNNFYIAAAVYRGLSGLVEWTEENRTFSLESGIGFRVAIPAKTPVKSPICIVAAFMRGQGSPVIAGGFSNITTASAGGDRAFLSYLDTSSGTVTAAPSWTGMTANQNMRAVAALIW